MKRKTSKRPKPRDLGWVLTDTNWDDRPSCGVVSIRLSRAMNAEEARKAYDELSDALKAQGGGFEVRVDVDHVTVTDCEGHLGVIETGRTHTTRMVGCGEGAPRKRVGKAKP